ncbi:MAG: DUF669 domain-containing protein [Deltaproteobacteria bacterium]|nr:DUF669 domain-containing protein [Deltaproteobacteria bacterium]
MPEYDDFSDLDDLQPDWVNADDDLNSPIPDGLYQMRVASMELTRTKNTQKPMVKWGLEVIGPTHEGRKVFDNQVIHGDDAETKKLQLSFIKSRLKLCGCEPQKLGDLREPHVREQVLDVEVEVKKRTTVKGENEYVNYTFLRRLELDASNSPEEGRGF